MGMALLLPHCDNLSAIKTSDGSVVSPATLAGCTLASGTTYVFVLGGEKTIGEAALVGVQLQWDSSIILTSVNIETCQFAGKLGNADPVGAAVVSDYDTSTKGGWMQQNPSTGVYITVTSSDGTTGGATVTASTIAVAGGTAGGADIQLGNLGARRCRIKVVVAGTGGVLRCGMMAKAFA